MGEEFKRRFADVQVDKILTIEASGIGIACIAARYFDVPVVFAKKTQSINLDGEMYVAEVESFTHKCKNQVIVSKKFLKEGEHVLLIDDFLANGCALQGLLSLSLIHTLGIVNKVRDRLYRYDLKTGEARVLSPEYGQVEAFWAENGTVFFTCNIYTGQKLPQNGLYEYVEETDTVISHLDQGMFSISYACRRNGRVEFLGSRCV